MELTVSIVADELAKIKAFKNANISINKEKNIFDIYIRIRGNEDNTKDILNNIKEIEYQCLDFGIFELIFDLEDTEKVIEYLQDNF